MSDHLEAKREARRRKILNNSENRLKRITGNDESRATFSEFETEVDVLVNHSNTLNGCCVDEENDKLPQFSYQSVRTSDSVPQDFPISSENIPPNDHSDIPESISHKPVYQAGPLLYIPMAVLFRIFLEFKIDTICPQNMIVAFFIIKCSSIVLFGIQSSETSPLIKGLFILSGISPKKIWFIVTVFNVLSAAIEHFSMFTFSFVLSDAFINFFKSLH